MAQRRRKSPDRVTLARALSKLGVLSRTQARAAIQAGRVGVDGVVERDPDRWVDPDRGRIEIDGRKVQRQAAVYLALHKPEGVVTTRADERGRQTVYDLLPAGTPWLFPVGRLDRDSTGLLLLTNDTRLGETVTGPRSHLPKVYEVTFDAPLPRADAERFRRGARLADGTELLPVGVAVPDPAHAASVVLTLREGRNRQIRRMAADCGLRVLRLHRVAIGGVRLSALPEGAVRPLTRAEVDSLRREAARRRPPGRGS